MARKARKISPTNYYHLMMRGSNREKIFKTDEQKIQFLELLKKFGSEEAIEVVAYCLMDNHVHLVVNGEIGDLSASMKRISIRYAMKYNKETDRIGNVFQDRYKSEVIADDQYLLQVVRYVHNNPVKAKMIENTADYKWSSYNEYINGKVKLLSKKQKNFIMEFFSGDLELFKKFHQENDLREYLDIKEEIKYSRLESAKKIILDYEITEGKAGTDSAQLTSNPEYLDGLIRKLLEETKLSHRKIAELLEISSNRVHKASLR